MSRYRRNHRRRAATTSLFAIGLVLAACADDDDSAGDTAGGDRTTAAPGTTRSPTTTALPETTAAPPTSDGSDEEYFQGLDAVIVGADERFEGEAFEGITSARQGIENVAEVFEDAAAEFDELEPPDDLQDLHEELVESAAGTAERIREVADETAEDVPLKKLGRLFDQEPLASLTADPADSPNCRLKSIADERGIEVGDLGCDLDDDDNDEDSDAHDE